MVMKIESRWVVCKLVAALILSSGALPARAHDVFLQAQQFTPPAGSPIADIPMWGYAECTDINFDDCGPASSPGPQIQIPADDSTLTIYLNNQLPQGLANVVTSSSVLIPSLPKALQPERFGVGDPLEGRIYSFDVATGFDQTTSYTWNNVPPGTFMYQSGTHPQVQVQMGLFGVVVKNAADATLDTPAEAYAGVPFDSDQVLVYSEIDPSVHDAVGGGTYNGSTEDYKPRFFLINGAPSAVGSRLTIDATAGEGLLLRLVNAGIESHAPQLLGGYFDIVAQDGKQALVDRAQHTVQLPAAKTLDVIFTPTSASTYPLIDRHLRLVNDTETGGGMLATIETVPPASP